jgi:hypothetical protein
VHFCETGLLQGRPEKKPKRTASAATPVHSLQSGLQASSAENGHLLRISGGGTTDFLCCPDWVAEGLRFEPSVQFSCAKPRRVRKLQIVKNVPENFHCKTDIRASQSVRFRVAVHSNLKANARRYCGKKWSLCETPGGPIRFACDWVPRGQSQNRTFLRSREQNGDGICDLFLDFVPGVSHQTTGRLTVSAY